MKAIWPYLGGAALILVGFWYVHHRSYAAGQAEREAHYQPILAAIEKERVATEARTQAQEKALAADITELENSLANTLSTQREAERASHVRIAGLVRDISACRLKPLPNPSAHPGESGSAAGIAERTAEIGAELAQVAAAAQRDAFRLGACQGLLRAERNILTN